MPRSLTQKKLVRPITDFVDTGEVFANGNGKPKRYRKTSKDAREKSFALKYKGIVGGSFMNVQIGPLPNPEIALIKLKYDLYELCGVKVPKTYLVEEVKANGEVQLQLASKIEPGFINLYDWLGGKLQTPERREFRRNCFRQKGVEINGKLKPIKGLFENLGVIAFLYDYDAVGGDFSNIGLIDQDDHLVAVKIDPECAALTTLPDNQNYANAGLEDRIDKIGGNILKNFSSSLYQFKDIWHLTEVFDHASVEEKMDGVKRVMFLKTEDLHAVIYNPKIPENYLPKEERDVIFNSLIARRNSFREIFRARLSADEVHHLQTSEIKLEPARTTQLVSNVPATPILVERPKKNKKRLFPTVLILGAVLGSVVLLGLMTACILSAGTVSTFLPFLLPVTTAIAPLSDFAIGLLLGGAMLTGALIGSLIAYEIASIDCFTKFSDNQSMNNTTHEKSRVNQQSSNMGSIVRDPSYTCWPLGSILNRLNKKSSIERELLVRPEISNRC